MDPLINDWLSLALRWAHVITGIAWIGSSFFFMWLDSHLEPPPTSKPGVEGELWMTHSGGFYITEKMALTPAQMPATLHWFKWEAAFTWITGILLLFVIYYAGASIYLIDPAVSALSPVAAILAGLAVLIVSWLVYDALWQSALARNNAPAATAVSFLMLVGLTFGLGELFSGRGAYMHVGAVLGTIMAANVWVRIIPAQRQMVAATTAGTPPDATLGQNAKRRSVHNNYMTLPVLFVMLSNHYPGTYGHEYGWAVLLVLFLIGATVRHWFNLRNRGQKSYWPIPVSLAAFLAVAYVSAPSGGGLAIDAMVDDEAVPFAAVQGVIVYRCRACHAAKPSHEAFEAPPKGVIFDSPEQIKRHASRILAVAVITKTMPLGDETGMTPEERALLGRWIYQGAKIE